MRPKNHFDNRQYRELPFDLDESLCDSSLSKEKEAEFVRGQHAVAHETKAQLAEKALQADEAAEAALTRKQAIVEQLEVEEHEAEAVVQEENASLQQAQANVNAAMQAAQQATTQLKTLTGAIQIAQANVANSEQAAQGAQEELQEKTQLLEAAKNRVQQLLRQLSAARTDLSNTEQASYKAAASAHEAKINASRNRRNQRKFRHREKRSNEAEN